MIVSDSARIAATPSRATARGVLRTRPPTSGIVLALLAVVAHEGGRAALVADHRDLAPRRGRDHSRRSPALWQPSSGLVQTPEGIWRQRLRLWSVDRYPVDVIVDGNRGAGGASVHDPLTGVPRVR